MRRVVILAFPGLQTLDVHGPAEVFTTATTLNRGEGYALEVVATEPGPVRTSSVALQPDGTVGDCGGPIDTLLVPGGAGGRYRGHGPRAGSGRGGPRARRWPSASRSGSFSSGFRTT
jgi:transcriptional regulator GlxA family with amidase domain